MSSCGTASIPGTVRVKSRRRSEPTPQGTPLTTHVRWNRRARRSHVATGTHAAPRAQKTTVCQAQPGGPVAPTFLIPIHAHGTSEEKWLPKVRATRPYVRTQTSRQRAVAGSLVKKHTGITQEPLCLLYHAEYHASSQKPQQEPVPRNKSQTRPETNWVSTPPTTAMASTLNGKTPPT